MYTLELYLLRLDEVYAGRTQYSTTVLAQYGPQPSAPHLISPAELASKTPKAKLTCHRDCLSTLPHPFLSHPQSIQQSHIMASTPQISKKRKFIADGVFQAELGEFL